MKPQKERMLYDLSDRLGHEIMVLEVGREVILPRQKGTAAHVETERGANWEFMRAAIDRPQDPVVWTHTHPGFQAFFSTTDVEGAHAYHGMLNDKETDRAVTAVVLGKNGDRHVERIDRAWIEANPKPLAMPKFSESTGGVDLGDWFELMPDGTWRMKREAAPPRMGFNGPSKRHGLDHPRLRQFINALCANYGQAAFLDLLESMNIIHLIPDEAEIDYGTGGH